MKLTFIFFLTLLTGFAVWDYQEHAAIEALRLQEASALATWELNQGSSSTTCHQH